MPNTADTPDEPTAKKLWRQGLSSLIQLGRNMGWDKPEALPDLEPEPFPDPYPTPPVVMPDVNG